MSRGTPHPENLKPIQTPEEAKEKGRLGGINSGKVRRRYALFRDILQDIMTQPIKVPFQKELICADVAICFAQVRKAVLEGDTAAATWCRDTMGQKPKEEFTGSLSLPVIVDDLIPRKAKTAPKQGTKRGMKRGKRQVK